LQKRLPKKEKGGSKPNNTKQGVIIVEEEVTSLTLPGKNIAMSEIDWGNKG